MKTNIKVHGIAMRVRITREPDAGRYHCVLAQESHYNDHAVYGDVLGVGDTEDEAIKDFRRRATVVSHA